MADNPAAKTALWVRVTLFLSLAINLLILGIVAGFLVLGGPDRRADRDGRDLGSFYTRALTDADRRALRREFMAGLADGRRDRDTLMADLHAPLETLRTTPFDADAFASAMADQSTRRAQREELGRRLLAARIAAMSDAERAAYADRIEERLSGLARRMRE